MILKTIISAIVLLALVIPALGFKQFFNKNAESVIHSCNHDKNDSDTKESCSFCPTEELSNHSV
ncbi:MAG: hypothetical protein L3J56_04490 [Bacteroidales bacterium]|nr:hypothetical protein [Bacteroidales bacterium]